MIDATSDHFIICGFGRVGQQVARDLRAAGARYVVIDPDPENLEKASGIGVRVIEGQASDDESLRRAGVERARAVVACVDSDAENIFITLTVRELNPKAAVVARASREDSEAKLRRAGADRVISPYKSSGSEMARLALHPQISGAVEVDAGHRFEEIEVSDGCAGAGQDDRRRARRRVHRRAPPARRLVPGPAAGRDGALVRRHADGARHRRARWSASSPSSTRRARRDGPDRGPARRGRRGRFADRRGQERADAGAPAPGRARRLLDERGDAAGQERRRAAARDRRAARRNRWASALARTSPRPRSRDRAS